jgi:6-phosphogluconate dehydrogenase (decarboxylating)
MTSLAETFELVKQAEFETKLASLQKAWGDDEVRLDLMDQAIDIVKEAQANGELPEMDEAQILDLCVAMVEDAMEEEQEKTASEESEEAQEELSEEELEKQAEALYDLGQDVGVILAENDITAEDIEKLAEEDADQLGREVARELVARYEALESAE